MSDSAVYQIYIDDSGQKEYGRATSRYFVYAGRIVEAAEEAAIAQRFADLKERVFGDPAVEIKSNWMRLPHERRKRYLDPYGLGEEEFDAFAEEWYELMSSEDLTYLAAVIDKPQMLARYVYPYNASGVISYVVSQRTSELGVRKALGAQAADIRSLVLRKGMTSVVIGLALGLASAVLVSRMLTSLLFETSPFDPLTFVAGPIVFLVVAAVACIVPARKAAGIDPAEALRSD